MNSVEEDKELIPSAPEDGAEKQARRNHWRRWEKACSNKKGAKHFMYSDRRSIRPFMPFIAAFREKVLLVTPHPEVALTLSDVMEFPVKVAPPLDILREHGRAFNSVFYDWSGPIREQDLHEFRQAVQLGVKDDGLIGCSLKFSNETQELKDALSEIEEHVHAFDREPVPEAARPLYSDALNYFMLLNDRLSPRAFHPLRTSALAETVCYYKGDTTAGAYFQMKVLRGRGSDRKWAKKIYDLFEDDYDPQFCFSDKSNEQFIQHVSNALTKLRERLKGTDKDVTADIHRACAWFSLFTAEVEE